MAKNNSKANKFRAIGNEFLKASCFTEALLEYNRSLCWAEPNSETAAFAYGNRSAVYFQLAKYELCIRNIELAKASRYPEDKVGKLDQRKTNAQRLLEETGHEPEEWPGTFKLGFPPSLKQPYLAECLELHGGKFIITTKELKPGDVVALIEPAFVLFNNQARLHVCTNCIKNSMYLSLIPCPTCSMGKRNNSNVEINFLTN